MAKTLAPPPQTAPKTKIRFVLQNLLEIKRVIQTIQKDFQPHSWRPKKRKPFLLKFPHLPLLMFPQMQILVPRSPLRGTKQRDIILALGDKSRNQPKPSSPCVSSLPDRGKLDPFLHTGHFLLLIFIIGNCKILPFQRNHRA